MYFSLKFVLLGQALFLSKSLASVPYSEYILAPSSRTLVPSSVYHVNGTISNAKALTSTVRDSTKFYGKSSVSLDFGKNVGGVVSLKVAGSSSQDAWIGVTFTESSIYVSDTACDATADAGLDEPLWFHVGKGPGLYTAARQYDRGAFRYMTVVSNTTATVELLGLFINFTAAPTQDLRAYTGYFHSDDELLNRIWYAGAYTNQLCTIDPHYGNTLNFLGVIQSGSNVTMTPWWANYTIANGSSVLVDGAKRDRLVWPGDMAIALPSIFVSTNDLASVRNGLESLLLLQKPDGQLPYAGVPFVSDLAAQGVNLASYTYHLHSLGAIYNYYIFSGDNTWLRNHWNQYKDGLEWALVSVDSTGLANVTQSADWLRSGMGKRNIEANAILFSTLRQAIELASVLEDWNRTSTWGGVMLGIKIGANEQLWDSSVGLYHDNETYVPGATLYPQDGNTWAIKAGLPNSDVETAQISDALRARWGVYGAPAPEAGDTVSPFVSGFELEAHFLAGKPQAALDLMRLEWGFMLNDPRMTNSTFIEGYSTNGSLIYAPYQNSPRISHAHGWATGPTFALSMYAAGIHLTGAAGSTWVISPQPGDLESIEAGYTTSLGQFSVSLKASNGTFSQLSFVTPNGTQGDVQLPGVNGILVEKGGNMTVTIIDGTASYVPGGSWELRMGRAGARLHMERKSV